MTVDTVTANLLPPSFVKAQPTPLTFILNRTKIHLDPRDNAIDVDVTLLDFIRAQGFTGTKLGCAEGGCGACTVVIGRPTTGQIDEVSTASRKYSYMSVNACLTPLVSVHGAHVLTVEGIGSTANPHPVQERIAKMFGSQCGFCTPGIVMSLYATVRNATTSLTESEIEHSLDGNLCRCTGYRPILDAAKSFAFGPGSDASDTDSTASPTTPPPNESEELLGSVAKEFSCPRGDECCKVKPGSNGCGVAAPIAPSTSSESSASKVIAAHGFKPYDAASEPIFPPYLATKAARFLGDDLAFVVTPKAGDRAGAVLKGAWGATEADSSDDEEAAMAKDLISSSVSRADTAAHSADLSSRKQDVSTNGGSSSIWLRPGSLRSLVEALHFYAQQAKSDPSSAMTALPKLRSGNTETGIEVKFKHSRFQVSIFVSDHISCLGGIAWPQDISSQDAVLAVGANHSLNDLAITLRKRLAADTGLPTYAAQTMTAITSNLRHFASNQVRNVSTLAGNIVTASPISDLNPVWVAIDATVGYIDAVEVGEALQDGQSLTDMDILKRFEKHIPMSKFFLAYRKTALPASGVLTRVYIPLSPPASHPSATSFVRAYKQAKRKDDDIAIVTSCLRLTVVDGIVDSVLLSYGGMAPTTCPSPKAQAALTGKVWKDRATLLAGLDALAQDFDLPFGVPGGMPAYRKSLAMGFLTRFWAETCQALGGAAVDTADNEDWLRVRELGLDDLDRPVTCGTQDLDEVDILTSLKEKPAGASGQSVPHLAALKQVTGEAIYVDDMPPFAHELYGALILSQKAHARIVKIDEAPALAMPGVTHVVTVKDIPKGGSNIWCPPAMDDVIFAEEEVFTVGQVIGVVLADTKKRAQAGARAVQIEYEVLPHMLTIEDAIAAGSYFKPRPVIARGDVDENWTSLEQDDDVLVLEGETLLGGQEHFYLETNACIVVPGREDNEFDVFSSTQNAAETQVFCASVLGIPNNRVTVRTKRLGGGFGGKESRPVAFAAVLCVAARKSGRPVRCMLDRDEDMLISGQRHPFRGKWRIATRRSTGKILRLEATVFNNGGWSQDLSQAVLERAMFHIENCYNIPTLRVRGFICKTNTMSNTAFRGFGGPQGMFISEDYMCKIASHLDMPVEVLRERNLYKEGELTHFKQPLIDWNIPGLWEQLKVSGEWEARRASVDAFNKQNRWRKRGLSMVPTKFGISFTAIFLNQASCLIHILQHDGSVLLSHGGIEMGQGLHTKMAQVCASELRIPLDNIHIVETNTSAVANASATAASASSDLNGMAIKHACDQLNERMRRFRFPNGEAGEEVPFAKAAHDAYFNRVSLSAVGHYKTPEIGYDWKTGTGQPFFYFTQGVAISEVEVDVRTGDHRISRADVHMDIGRSINPSIDVGQVEGAFTQGFGLVTIEESLWRPDGQLATRGPGAYKIPAFLDTPADFRVSFIKGTTNADGSVRKSGHLRTIQSSKGVGEPPLFLGTSVFFALRDAIGSAREDAAREAPIDVTTEKLRATPRIFDLPAPATPERIRVSCADGLLRIATKGTEAPRRAGEQPFFVSIF